MTISVLAFIFIAAVPSSSARDQLPCESHRILLEDESGGAIGWVIPKTQRVVSNGAILEFILPAHLVVDCSDTERPKLAGKLALDWKGASYRESITNKSVGPIRYNCDYDYAEAKMRVGFKFALAVGAVFSKTWNCLSDNGSRPTRIRIPGTNELVELGAAEDGIFHPEATFSGGDSGTPLVFVDSKGKKVLGATNISGMIQKDGFIVDRIRWPTIELSEVSFGVDDGGSAIVPPRLQRPLFLFSGQMTYPRLVIPELERMGFISAQVSASPDEEAGDLEWANVVELLSNTCGNGVQKVDVVWGRWTGDRDHVDLRGPVSISCAGHSRDDNLSLLENVNRKIPKWIPSGSGSVSWVGATLLAEGGATKCRSVGVLFASIAAFLGVNRLPDCRGSSGELLFERALMDALTPVQARQHIQQVFGGADELRTAIWSGLLQRVPSDLNVGSCFYGFRQDGRAVVKCRQNYGNSDDTLSGATWRISGEEPSRLKLVRLRLEQPLAYFDDGLVVKGVFHERRWFYDVLMDECPPPEARPSPRHTILVRAIGKKRGLHLGERVEFFCADDHDIFRAVSLVQDPAEIRRYIFQEDDDPPCVAIPEEMYIWYEGRIFDNELKEKVCGSNYLHGFRTAVSTACFEDSKVLGDSDGCATHTAVSGSIEDSQAKVTTWQSRVRPELKLLLDGKEVVLCDY
jgi:hypothetical protein